MERVFNPPPCGVLQKGNGFNPFFNEVLQMNRFTVLSVAVLVFVAAHDATAQGFINPLVGTTLTSPTSAGSSTKPGYGVSLGRLGKVIGGETEIAFFPELIDSSANATAKNKIISFSGSTLIGPTLGRIKPYFALGGGNLY